MGERGPVHTGPARAEGIHLAGPVVGHLGSSLGPFCPAPCFLSPFLCVLKQKKTRRGQKECFPVLGLAKGKLREAEEPPEVP